jgi:glycine hydroxymethyltransferase
LGTILVVCTGNVCRSPMALGFLRRELDGRGLFDVEVASAGVAGLQESPPTQEAVEAAGEHGVDISEHRGARLTRAVIEWADLIVAMAAEHQDAVVRLSPRADRRTFTLKQLVASLRANDPAAIVGPDADLGAAVQRVEARRGEAEPESTLDTDIADPIGMGLETYRAVAWEIDELIRSLATGLFGPVTESGRDAARPGGGSDAYEGGRGEMRTYAASWEALQATDPEVAAAVADELQRERTTLRLIASENYASPAVLAALGSTMNNKYAEGYPGRRYYGGCEFVDVTETLAIERAKDLFGAEHANVQPHAGAQANLAVYGAFLEPRDPDVKVLGLVLAHGGHLTHGSPVNVSGKWFSFVGYEVDRTSEVIDLDRVRDLALEHRPRMILAGFTAYPRAIDFEGFRRIADEVGALFMVDASHFIGLVAGGVYPNPVPYADVVTFTTHKTLRGPRGAIILSKSEHARAIDKAVFPMMQGGPLEHVIAAKAVCLKEAMQPEFRDYADRVVRTARALAQGLEDRGLRLVSGGTDSHLALVDLRPIGMTGADAETRCEAVGIALNKNAIPFDPLPPATASGIRVGTPGPATLGMDEAEMKEIAQMIGDVLVGAEDAAVRNRIRGAVRELMGRFPAYPG